VFIDAYPCDDTSRQVQLREITPTPHAELNNHHSDPHALLALTQILHGRSPRAWWLLIPAERYDHGVALSKTTRAGVRAATEMVSVLIPAIDSTE
jgi:Ni,Fe-hydrogenase maturation factor